MKVLIASPSTFFVAYLSGIHVYSVIFTSSLQNSLIYNIFMALLLPITYKSN
jgi:hypothetical protein